MQREGCYTECVCVTLCVYACLCESVTITVCVCGHWGPVSWLVHGEQNTGPTLRTWGTWVDVKGLTESKGLRLGPTQTLTYCVCCLCHCVLENKSFGGDTGSKGYPWAATQAWALCYISCVCFRFWSCWNYTVSLTVFLLYFSSPMSSSSLFSEVVPNSKHQQGGPKYEQRCVRSINLLLSV